LSTEKKAAGDNWLPDYVSDIHAEIIRIQSFIDGMNYEKRTGQKIRGLVGDFRASPSR
jgi:hypothetical protein